MILDGATLDPKSLPTYDICIVGAGAVGIAMAHRLRKKDGTGLRVVVLESSVANVRGSKSPGALHAYDPILHPPPGVIPSQIPTEKQDTDPIVLDLDRGFVNAFTNAARSEGFLTASRSRTFGGSTNCWGGYIRPLDEHDFDGWPLKREDLVPFYRDALELMKLDHFDWFDKPQEWIDSKLTWPIAQLDPPPHSPLRTVVIQQQQDPDIHCFQLQFGDVFDHDNITLIRNATALYMKTGWATSSNFHSTGLRCGSLIDAKTRGQDFEINAKYYVLAMGGLEIPRFLLNCIPGSYGLTELVQRGLSKYYMNHPKYTDCGSGYVTLNKPITEALKHFYDGTSLRTNSKVRIYAYLVPDPANRDKAINNFRLGLGLDRPANPGERVKVGCEVNFEQEPNESSRVSLSTEVDVFGMRRLYLNWRFVEKDALTMNRSIEQARQLISSLGTLSDWKATEWKFDHDYDWPYPPLNGHQYTGDHHMGTCRMRSADTADDGVVNSRCQVSRFTNLWICSTGVFRRGGWANATFTLLALALRLADDLAKQPPLQSA